MILHCCYHIPYASVCVRIFVAEVIFEQWDEVGSERRKITGGQKRVAFQPTAILAEPGETARARRELFP
jgi:hypothetical protein